MQPSHPKLTRHLSNVQIVLSHFFHLPLTRQGQHQHEVAFHRNIYGHSVFLREENVIERVDQVVPLFSLHLVICLHWISFIFHQRVSDQWRSTSFRWEIIRWMEPNRLFYWSQRGQSCFRGICPPCGRSFTWLPGFYFCLEYRGLNKRRWRRCPEVSIWGGGEWGCLVDRWVEKARGWVRGWMVRMVME